MCGGGSGEGGQGGQEERIKRARREQGIKRDIIYKEIVDDKLKPSRRFMRFFLRFSSNASYLFTIVITRAPRRPLSYSFLQEPSLIHPCHASLGLPLLLRPLLDHDDARIGHITIALCHPGAERRSSGDTCSSFPIGSGQFLFLGLFQHCWMYSPFFICNDVWRLVLL